jgi:hypothetical protein
MNSLLQNETSTMFGSAAGLRCRATRQIRTHAGNVQLSAEGTIISEIDNLGRHLIEVDWQNGVRAYVFPHEVEIVSDKNAADVWQLEGGDFN